jgi:rootletin
MLYDKSSAICILIMQVLQYKQRCLELENQMVESLPVDEDRLLTSSLPSQLILQAAQKTMREMREEQICDLDTALKKLNEERNRYFISSTRDT